MRPATATTALGLLFLALAAVPARGQAPAHDPPSIRLLAAAATGAPDLAAAPFVNAATTPAGRLAAAPLSPVRPGVTPASSAPVPAWEPAPRVDRDTILRTALGGALIGCALGVFMGPEQGSAFGCAVGALAGGGLGALLGSGL